MCYLPGTLLLGVHNGLSRRFANTAEQLLFTCYKMYKEMPTGLSPEIVHFNMSRQSTQDFYVKVSMFLYLEHTVLNCTIDTREYHKFVASAHRACV